MPLNWSPWYYLLSTFHSPYSSLDNLKMSQVNLLHLSLKTCNSFTAFSTDSVYNTMDYLPSFLVSFSMFNAENSYSAGENTLLLASGLKHETEQEKLLPAHVIWMTIRSNEERFCVTEAYVIEVNFRQWLGIVKNKRRQEEKVVTDNEMGGWHYWLNGYEFEQAPGVSEGQGHIWQLQFMGSQRVRHDSTQTIADMRAWTPWAILSVIYFTQSSMHMSIPRSQEESVNLRAQAVPGGKVPGYRSQENSSLFKLVMLKQETLNTVDSGHFCYLKNH